MSDTLHDQSSDDEASRALMPWEHWEEHDGESIIVFDEEAHAVWREKWAPRRPDGSPQRLAHPLGFRERNVGELELRVALGAPDHGACQVIVDEQDDEVYVRVLVCYDEADDDRRSRTREYTDCPVRVWLEKPLGQRAVIDVDSDEELPLFTPSWFDDVPQPDAGYRPANRRRARVVAPECRGGSS
jgi:hypothetical protein